MNCPICSSPALPVAQTILPNKCMVIVRECTATDPHALMRFETIEVPHSIISVLGVNKFDKLMTTAMRGYQRREQTAYYRQVVRTLYGHKPNTEIARFLKISDARVHQIMREESPDFVPHRQRRVHLIEPEEPA